MTRLGLARPWVALSGEKPDERILTQASGVGMIRSEYLIRESGSYFGRKECDGSIFAYLSDVMSSCAGPVWYRLADLEERDIRVLRDAPRIHHYADNPILRLRGSARWIVNPEALVAELRAILTFTRDRRFGIVVPYCHDDLHLRNVVEMIRRAGVDCRVAAMVETPSAVLTVDAVLAQVDAVLIGTNDLTTLTLGCQRQDPHYSAAHPSVVAQIRTCIEAGRRAGKSVRIAGNYGPDLTTALSDLEADKFVIHYCDWGSQVAGSPAEYLNRWDSVRLRAASDQRLIKAGLLHPSNLVAVAGIRDNGRLWCVSDDTRDLCPAQPPFPATSEAV